MSSAFSVTFLYSKLHQVLTPSTNFRLESQQYNSKITDYDCNQSHDLQHTIRDLFSFKSSHSALQFVFLNVPSQASFSFFHLFKQTLQFVQPIYVKMVCPSSIRRQDSNPRPLEHESPPITTWPGLPPNLFRRRTPRQFLPQQVGRPISRFVVKLFNFSFVWVRMYRLY